VTVTRSRNASSGRSLSANGATTIDVARIGLASQLDAEVVERLIDTYRDLKANYYLGGHRLSAVEAGRFCEAVVRLLQQSATSQFTALDQNLELDRELRRLEGVTSIGDSLRLHIPRAIRVIYGIRNKRDTAHLNDGIDPNVQDSTLVATTCDWIMAELVRLHHDVSPQEATKAVHDLVKIKAPLIQDFDGYLKVLNPSLKAGDHVLLLLHQRGAAGASIIQLNDWSRPNMRQHLKRTLDRLVYEKAWAHEEDGQYYITTTGIAEVSDRRLMNFA
jgi:hypothetical protein